MSGGRALPLLALLALALLPLGQVATVLGAVGAVLAAVVVAVGRRGRSPSAVRTATLALLLGGVGLLGVPFALWLVVGTLWLASRRWPELRPDAGWLPPGRSSAWSWAVAAVTVLGAAGALTAWVLSEPALGATTLQLVDLARRAPAAAVVAFVVVFVVVNPVVEEVAYRNVAYEAARHGAPTAAVVLQAAAFATLHVAGFPAGAIGVALAFVYGLALGVVRATTGGLRLAVLCHVATNATIAALVIVVLLPD